MISTNFVASLYINVNLNLTLITEVALTYKHYTSTHCHCPRMGYNTGLDDIYSFVK